MAKANTPVPDDELLNQLNDGPAADDGDDFDDLLGQVVEDDSEAWMPSEKDEYVTGLVVKVAQQRSDFAKPGEDPMVPAITIEGIAGTPSGEKTKGKWRVIAYASVLKRNIEEQDPAIKVGDRMAVRFFGEKPIKKGPYAGRPFKHFEIAVGRKQA